ncbi:MAG: polyprenyl diphosphate synthase [bacterium]|nr:polyprenyl diphosphate synthase [bacterium]
MTQHIPKHITIIPDGNRRWAKKKGLLPWNGHKKGEEKFREITQAVFKSGVPYVTFWAASEANLQKRALKEVEALVDIFSNGLDGELKSQRLRNDRIRFRVIGRWKEILEDRGLVKLVQRLDRLIGALQGETAEFTGRHLTVLFGNNDKRETLEAASQMIKNGLPVDEKNLLSVLATGFLPDVDLEIRAGEEMAGWSHNSAGFLMWLSANAERYHTKTLWPDFSKDELVRALEDFSERRRKLGS